MIVLNLGSKKPVLVHVAEETSEITKTKLILFLFYVLNKSIIFIISSI